MIYNVLEEVKKFIKFMFLIVYMIIGKGVVGLEGSEKMYGLFLNKEVLK